MNAVPRSASAHVAARVQRIRCCLLAGLLVWACTQCQTTVHSSLSGTYLTRCSWCGRMENRNYEVYASPGLASYEVWRCDPGRRPRKVGQVPSRETVRRMIHADAARPIVSMAETSCAFVHSQLASHWVPRPVQPQIQWVPHAPVPVQPRPSLVPVATNVWQTTNHYYPQPACP